MNRARLRSLERRVGTEAVHAYSYLTNEELQENLDLLRFGRPAKYPPFPPGTPADPKLAKLSDEELLKRLASARTRLVGRRERLGREDGRGRR